MSNNCKQMPIGKVSDRFIPVGMKIGVNSGLSTVEFHRFLLNLSLSSFFDWCWILLMVFTSFLLASTIWNGVAFVLSWIGFVRYLGIGMMGSSFNDLLFGVKSFLAACGGTVPHVLIFQVSVVVLSIIDREFRVIEISKSAWVFGTLMLIQVTGFQVLLDEIVRRVVWMSVVRTMFQPFIAWAFVEFSVRTFRKYVHFEAYVVHVLLIVGTSQVGTHSCINYAWFAKVMEIFVNWLKFTDVCGNVRRKLLRERIDVKCDDSQFQHAMRALPGIGAVNIDSHIDHQMSEIEFLRQGVGMSDRFRMLALLGDRRMSLVVAKRATREGMVVRQVNDYVQTYLTNAAFSRVCDAYLVRNMSGLALRSEAMRGSVVEAMVGAADVAGVDDSDVMLFLDNVRDLVDHM